jgi:hypothetical protein
MVLSGFEMPFEHELDKNNRWLLEFYERQAV